VGELLVKLHNTKSTHERRHWDNLQTSIGYRLDNSFTIHSDCGSLRIAGLGWPSIGQPVPREQREVKVRYHKGV